MMGGGDMRRAKLCRRAGEKRTAGLARPLLEIGRGGIEAAGLLGHQLDAERRAEIADEGLVAVGLRGAQAMIQMGGRESKPESRRKLAEHMKQRDRIGAARECVHDRFTGRFFR